MKCNFHWYLLSSSIEVYGGRDNLVSIYIGNAVTNLLLVRYVYICWRISKNFTELPVLLIKLSTDDTRYWQKHDESIVATSALLLMYVELAATKVKYGMYNSFEI